MPKQKQQNLDSQLNNCETTAPQDQNNSEESETAEELPDNITIRFLDLPHDINGFTLLGCDDHYSIYLNARLNYDMQKQALKHELYHIQQGHFYEKDMKTVDALETETRKKA